MLNMFQLYINFNAIPIYKADSVLTEKSVALYHWYNYVLQMS